MDKYVQVAEKTVKVLETVMAIVVLGYLIICFERWQRPDGVKNIKKKFETVDTIKTSV